MAMSAMFSAGSDYRNDVVVSGEVKHTWDTHGKRGYTVEAELELRPASWTAWEIRGEGEYINGQEAWMTNDDVAGHSIFADRDTRAISATVRGSVTLHRDMTLQLYSQVFTAKGRYRNPRMLFTASRFGSIMETTPKNFAGQEFNLNLVFRWEYLPGSTLYLVLSQARVAGSDNYDASWSKDVENLFATAPSTVLIGKMTFWWNI
jgi:hypothetical protein